MRVFIFGDANVDVTVGWHRVEAGLRKLSRKTRGLILDNMEASKELDNDIEHYLPARNAELSNFFDSLNPKIKLGGCGAIKAMTMASLGHDVVFYSWVGDDKNGGLVLKELSRAGVDVSHVKVSGKTCETYNLFDRRRPRLAFSFWENKLSLLPFIKAVKKEKPDLVPLTGAHRLRKGLGYARLPGAYVFTGSFAGYTKGEIRAKYKKDLSRSILVSNDAEIMQLSGLDPISGIAFLPNNTIIMHGTSETAVKRNCNIMITGTGRLDQAKVVEKTGIGDVWESVFLSSVGSLEKAPQKRIMEAMQIATKAARRRMLAGRFP